MLLSRPSWDYFSLGAQFLFDPAIILCPVARAGGGASRPTAACGADGGGSCSKRSGSRSASRLLIRRRAWSTGYSTVKQEGRGLVPFRWQCECYSQTPAPAPLPPPPPPTPTPTHDTTRRHTNGDHVGTPGGALPAPVRSAGSCIFLLQLYTRTGFCTRVLSRRGYRVATTWPCIAHMRKSSASASSLRRR